MERNDEVRRREDDPERRPRRRLMFAPALPGLLIIGVGIVFLLGNFNLIESRQVLRLWPLILIAVGVKHLFDARERGTAFSGAVLVGAGGLLLLDSLNIIDVDIWDLWPLVLVAVGVRILTHAMSDPAPPVEATESAESCHAFLGSVERRNRSANFRGGSASAFMGGVNLDLTKADIAGDRAVIRVFAMMGGIEIRIPEEWTTEVRIAPMLGGVEDKTRGPAAATKRLVLQGTVLMGGVEIRN